MILNSSMLNAPVKNMCQAVIVCYEKMYRGRNCMDRLFDDLYSIKQTIKLIQPVGMMITGEQQVAFNVGDKCYLCNKDFTDKNWRP